MAEMVHAIGVTMEEKLLEDIKKCPYYSLIMDEATDISVTKLGLCVQYLGSDAEVQIRNLKLLEVSQGTADVITFNCKLPDLQSTYCTKSLSACR